MGTSAGGVVTARVCGADGCSGHDTSWQGVDLDTPELQVARQPTEGERRILDVPAERREETDGY